MASDILVYVAAAIVLAWGVAHLVPTRAVVVGFGDISLANRRVLTMEWMAEGFTLVFLALLLAAVTAEAGAHDHVAVLVYRLAAGLLAAVAVLTELTGARTPVRWFKACPVVLGTAAVLLVVASVL